MRWSAIVLAALFVGAPVLGQAVSAPPAAAPPTLEQVRKDMGIPSEGVDLRGQRDAVGFASRADQMAKVWELSTSPPPPELLGPAPAPGVAAVICPHDDYLYAGRVYRQVLPLITAKTVILVGVFHKYRQFGVRDQLVFDSYHAWRTPDGPAPVSSLRDQLIGGLPAADALKDAAMHDSEHSLEALVYWLKHIRPDLQIVPIIVPAAKFDRLGELAHDLGKALAAAMKERRWRLGRDVAIAISTDGVHYGADFKYTPYGAGGKEALKKAQARDRSLLEGPLKGPISTAKVKDLYSAFVNPDRPDEYRLTWCGRFAVPFGLLLLDETARAAGQGRPVGHPVAYATSVGWPALPVQSIGLGATAPATLEHFVGYPSAAFTLQ